MFDLTANRRKKLSLDDPLSKFNIIRKNENISANITIKNLLSHSSGIQDYLTATTFNSSFYNLMRTSAEPLFTS
ncbi:serine hydrolase [Flavobacterium lindanitolerans]|nr:serine hydrolase [Flavobacterium lindanitolerans]